MYADPSTIDASIIWPMLLLLRSNNASIIPKTQINAPVKSVRLAGGVGFWLYRPNNDNKPEYY